VLLGRTEHRLKQTAAAVLELGGRSLIACADVAREEDVLHAAAAARAAFGTPSVVVNNAGTAGRRARIEETLPEEWDAVLGANLRGVFLVTRAFLPAMRAAGSGRIVTLGSISSTIGTAGLAAYCASKWGVLGFTKALAEELRGSGLQTLAILPGTVDTPMAEVGGFAPQMTAEEVARIVAFAALDAPAAMNGSAVECFGP
jgi:3-oxoacyl-[acyl-carrier protein] reductase